MHDGPRSAYETIRRITQGNLPPNIDMDMGFMDVEIKSDHNDKPRLVFEVDRDALKREVRRRQTIRHSRKRGSMLAPRLSTGR